MNISAKYSREWRDRMGIILLLLIGSAGWFFYDGLVAYPTYNLGASAYAQIVDAVKSEGLKDAAAETEAAKRWAQCAHEFSGDPEEPPIHAKNVDQQIHFGVGLSVIALAFLAWILREMKRVVRANDEEFDGLTTAFPPFNGVVRVKFASVFGIDRRKWENKGIAVIHFKGRHGRSRRAIIDDYKYAGSEAILDKCEEILAQKKVGEKSVSDET